RRRQDAGVHAVVERGEEAALRAVIRAAAEHADARDARRMRDMQLHRHVPARGGAGGGDAAALGVQGGQRLDRLDGGDEEREQLFHRSRKSFTTRICSSLISAGAWPTPANSTTSTSGLRLRIPATVAGSRTSESVPRST